MRTHVDLFSGIGGFALAARWAGVETIAFAEIDPYASRVLQRHWPNVRNYGDVRNVPELSAWLVTGGVPCQPASVAGKRRGAADDRWLWPEALAVVENGSYEWVLFENPTGILSLNSGVEFERICAALESKDYEVQPLVIPACAVGAPHRRNRVWIVAHSVNGRFRQLLQPERLVERGETSHVRRNGEIRSLAHAERPCRINEKAEADAGSTGGQGGNGFVSCGANSFADANGESTGRTSVSWCECNQWAIEPEVGRVANGIPKRVDRLRGLGNAIVPQVAYQLIKRMIEAEEQQ